jgi:hypothetical protein
MNFRITTLLFGLLLGALFVFGLMLALRKSSLDLGFVMPKLADSTKGSINYLEIAKKGGERYVFTKTKDGWRLKLPPKNQEVRVEERKVEEVIEDIRTARHSNAEIPDLTNNLEKYGLSPPPAKITVTLKDTSPGGLESQFFVGNTSEDKAFVYCSSSERKREVLAVKKAAINAVFFDNVDSFRVRQLLEGPETSVQRIDLKQTADGKELAFERVKEGIWRFVKPPLGPAEYAGSAAGKSEESVRGLLAAVLSLRAESFEPLDGITVDDKNAVLRIETETEAGGFAKKSKDKAPATKEVLLIGPKVRGTEKDEVLYYARLASTNEVVRVNGKQLEAVVFAALKDPRSLRSRDVAQFDATEADVVQIDRGKAYVKLFRRSEGKIGEAKWKVFSSDNPPRDGNAAAITGPTGTSGLLVDIQGRHKIAEKDFVDSSTPEKLAELKKKFEKIEAQVTVWTDSLEPEKTSTDPKKGDQKDKKVEKDQKKDKKDDTPPEMKKDAKPAVTLSFVAVDNTKMLVKREVPDSDPVFFELAKDLFNKMAPPEMALAFFDTAIETFSFAEAFKLQLVRVQNKDKEEFLVERKLPQEKKDEAKKDDKKDTAKDKKEPEKKAEPKKEDNKDQKKDEKKDDKEFDWKLLEPKDFAGKGDSDQREINDVLSQLVRMRAERWVRKVDTKDAKQLNNELAEFDLHAPTITTSVTYKKKEGDKEEPKTFVLKLGKKSARDQDKGGFYAFVDGADYVFVVAAGLEKALKEAEFRDRQVMKLEPAKVKELQCYILQDVEVRDPLFARDVKQGWLVKGGLSKNFDFDPEQVEKLVKQLADLNAVRYLNVKMPPPADYRLEGKNVPLKFELTMDDGKTKHWLTVGAPNEKDGPYYYAQCSIMPNVVFLVPKEKFEKYMGKVSYFSKG